VFSVSPQTEKYRGFFTLSDELGVPIITNSGLVIVGRGLCGGVFALDVATGKQRWNTELTGQGFCSDPYLSQDGKTVWITSSTLQDTSFWWSIDVVTGKTAQKGQFSDIGNPEMGFQRGNTISGESDATLYMYYDEGDVSCWPGCPANPQIWRVNSNTGESLETLFLAPQFVGITHEAAISTFSGLLYITNPDGDLMAVDPTGGSKGKILWTSHCPCTGACQTTPDFFDSSYQTYFPPLLVVSSEDASKGVVLTGLGNQICATDLGSGTLLWQYSLPTYIFEQPVVSPYGTIYVPTLTLHHGSRMLALR